MEWWAMKQWKIGMVEYWNVVRKQKTSWFRSGRLKSDFSFSMKVVIGSFIRIWKYLPSLYLFASFGEIQSTWVMNFRLYNGVGLIVHIPPRWFVQLAWNSRSMNEIPHRNQGQYLDDSNILLDSVDNNLFTPLNMNFPEPISMPHLKQEILGYFNNSLI